MFNEIIYKKKEKEQKLYFIAQTIAKKNHRICKGNYQTRFKFNRT